jgi:glycosyltransferase involved in cell wall biosynthesis
MGLAELSPELRTKTMVIHQSTPPIAPRTPLKTRFEVSVIGNLREEKDPFRCALAATLLPEKSRIQVVHVGRALDDRMAAQAQEMMSASPRYRWLGELPHWRTKAMLARSRLMVISSRMEGGANVVSEAFAACVPVVASAVSGNIGMLGTDYAGYYPCGDEEALARLLWRVESEPAFYQLLTNQCAERHPLFTPEHERNGLKRLLEWAYHDT